MVGAPRQRAEVVGEVVLAIRGELGEVPALAVDEPGEQVQRALVGERVELLGMRLERGDERWLERSVDVAVEQRGELIARSWGRAAELVDPAPELRDRTRVVVQVGGQQRLDLEARLQRQPAGVPVHGLAQHVDDVREAGGRLGGRKGHAAEPSGHARGGIRTRT